MMSADFKALHLGTTFNFQLICLHIYLIDDLRLVAVQHLSVQSRNVSKRYFDHGLIDGCAYFQIKSRHVTGFEAAVTLLATAQCSY